MSFNKAAQIVQQEEYQNYMQALFLYKKQSSEFAKIRNRYSRSTDMAERYTLFVAKEKYSQQSKSYQTARREYQDFVVRFKTKAKGIEFDTMSVAEALGIDIKCRTEEIIDEVRENAIIANSTDEQLEAIRRVALDYMKKRGIETQITKEEFLNPISERSRIKDDPTLGDFEPL